MSDAHTDKKWPDTRAVTRLPTGGTGVTDGADEDLGNREPVRGSRRPFRGAGSALGKISSEPTRGRTDGAGRSGPGDELLLISKSAESRRCLQSRRSPISLY